MGFKKDFAWGVATAAYQIEGAWDQDGKGLSVWDVFCHENNKIKDKTNGDIACDHYHRFKEDVKLLSALGIKSYRFSISWTRLFPNGTGELNQKGAKFYSDLIDELLKYNIEPYVTLFHWDYPYELYKKGGWLNDECVKWFANYATTVSKLYSDRVKNFITFNEPQCFIGDGHISGGHAPGLRLGKKDILQICHNVLKSHGAAVIALRENAKQPIKVGYAPTCAIYYPETETAANIQAAREKVFECVDINGNIPWSITWMSDPIIFGKYPEDGLRKYKDYLPDITEEDMRLINQPLDFYGFNIYKGTPVKVDGNGKVEIVKLPEGFPRTSFGWQITPECLHWAARFLYERYNKPIIITENGMSAHDAISLDGKVHDPNRIDYLERYLTALDKATDKGVELDGYFIWSFIDNFEWAVGYTERFGIVYVDYNTQQRIPKDSAYWYKNWIENH